MANKRAVVNVAAAKARLPELIERAAGGEEIVLARNGRPRARIVPIVPRKPYVFGAGRGRWKRIEPLLDEPLPATVAELFYRWRAGSPRRRRPRR